MRGNLAAAIWRFAIFVAVCVMGLFALIAVFAQLRFEKEDGYAALFSNVSGLQVGDFVRIAGVEVGKVKGLRLEQDSSVRVDFTADPSVMLTKGCRALIRYDDLIGGRYVTLEEGPGGTERLLPGQEIPLSNTAPALDLDALIGGFRPLFRALDPDQINQLSFQLISAFQGQGATIGSFLSQTAVLTNTLGDRDELIGQVITNLNTVFGSLAEQNDKFGESVDDLSELIRALNDRKGDIANTITSTNSAAAGVAELLDRARPPLKKVVAETDRVASIVVADHDYMDALLNNLPDKYQALGRQGIYGDFFSFYLCDLFLKLNGKGGQPVYVKVAGQDSGRCAPK